MIQVLSFPLLLPFRFDLFWIVLCLCDHNSCLSLVAVYRCLLFRICCRRQHMRNKRHLLTKSLSSVRDERLFRGTTLILQQSIVQLSRYAEVPTKGTLVDLRGLEPLTSSMPWMRSPSCATGPCE